MDEAGFQSCYITFESPMKLQIESCPCRRKGEQCQLVLEVSKTELQTKVRYVMHHGCAVQCPFSGITMIGLP